MRRNIFLSITGFETILVGVCMWWQRQFFLDDPKDKFIHTVHHMAGVNWSIALITVGLVAIVVGLTNYHKHNAQIIVLIVLGGLWCAYSLVFLIMDIHFKQSIGLLSMLTTCVFIRILVEARYGGGERNCNK